MSAPCCNAWSYRQIISFNRRMKDNHKSKYLNGNQNQFWKISTTEIRFYSVGLSWQRCESLTRYWAVIFVQFQFDLWHLSFPIHFAKWNSHINELVLIPKRIIHQNRHNEIIFPLLKKNSFESHDSFDANQLNETVSFHQDSK